MNPLQIFFKNVETSNAVTSNIEVTNSKYSFPETTTYGDFGHRPELVRIGVQLAVQAAQEVYRQESAPIAQQTFEAPAKVAVQSTLEQQVTTSMPTSAPVQQLHKPLAAEVVSQSEMNKRSLIVEAEEVVANAYANSQQDTGTRA